MCNTESCNWDNGRCVSCVPGCTWKLQHNRQCDSVCNVSECDYDSGNCSCALNCAQGDLGLCKPDCLVINCDYDLYTQANGCADDFEVKLSLYVGIGMSDLSTTREANQCTPTCSFDALKVAYQHHQCLSACSLPICGFAMGLCATLIPENCEVGWGPGYGQCLECISPYVQYFGYCTLTCPRGMQPYSLFASPRLCVLTPDTSSLDNPDTMMVRDDFSKTGTNEGDLYFNLMDAFSAAWETYTAINLIGATVTFEPKSIYSNTKYVEYKRHSNLPDVLSDGTWQYLRIQSSPCSANPVPGCFQGTTTLQIYPVSIATLVGKTLVLQDLIVTTKQLFASSGFDYCPALIKTKDGYMTDQGVLLTDIRSQYFQCSNYASVIFFTLGTQSHIYVRDVVVQHFTIQLKALVSLEGGSATFTNVTFSSDTEHHRL